MSDIRRTYIFSQQIRFSVVIYEGSRVPTLKPKGPLTPQIRILSTHRITSCNADLGFAVVRAINVHP